MLGPPVEKARYWPSGEKADRHCEVRVPGRKGMMWLIWVAPLDSLPPVRSKSIVAPGPTFSTQTKTSAVAWAAQVVAALPSEIWRGASQPGRQAKMGPL